MSWDLLYTHSLPMLAILWQGLCNIKKLLDSSLSELIPHFERHSGYQDRFEPECSFISRLARTISNPLHIATASESYTLAVTTDKRKRRGDRTYKPYGARVTPRYHSWSIPPCSRCRRTLRRLCQSHYPPVKLEYTACRELQILRPAGNNVDEPLEI